MGFHIDGLKFFKSIPPEEYRLYGIDLGPTIEKNVDWLVYPKKYWDDGPWLILAFLKSSERPDVVTFNISSYDGDYLFPPIDNMKGILDEAGRIKGFNIFEDTKNNFEIISEEFLDEIIKILQWQSDDLAAPLLQSPPHTFEFIEEQDYSKWSIQSASSEPVPGWEVIERYYYQTFDPLEETDNREHGTIIQFERNIHLLPMSLKIDHFPFSDLTPEYTHRFNSLGCINLDKKGATKFMWLLKLNWYTLIKPPSVT